MVTSHSKGRGISRMQLHIAIVRHLPVVCEGHLLTRAPPIGGEAGDRRGRVEPLDADLTRGPCVERGGCTALHLRMGVLVIRAKVVVLEYS
jgi:hypothetical protein